MHSIFRKDALVADPAFRLYWLSTILAGSGVYIGALALPLCSVVLLHASPAQMGLVGAFQAVPFAILALPAGVWLDRSRKKPILVACRIAQTLSLACIPAAWALGVLSMQWMYLVAVVQGCCSVLGGGAEQILLTRIVGREQLVDAQSKLTVTDSVARLVAPGFGGLLVQWLSAPFAVIVNALGFGISALMLRRVPIDEPLPPPSDKHPLRDMHEGLLFIWRQPLLRTLAWSAALWHLLFYGYVALSTLYVLRELKLDAGTLGAVQVLGGMGVLASGFLLKPVTRRFGQGHATLLGMIVTTMGFVCLPMLRPEMLGQHSVTVAACALLTFFFDCGVMMYFMPYIALRQQVTPDEFLGRMTSSMRFLTVASAPLGALLAGYAGEHLGIRAALAWIGAGGVALAIAAACSKTLRAPAIVAAP
ncbi:MFS transporter [Pseudoduganella sp. OTU4001]|uniref:MFS transporter n=1 Tax=Pseudoduganella sp. OTU4001 TaxID=3043854 RepID=UPI00313C9EEC